MGGLSGELGEFGGHGGVAASEALNSEVLGLVVGEAEVVFGREKSVFGLLEVVDGLVDFVNGGFELAAGEVIVAGEAVLERSDFGFKVGDVEVLAADEGKFALVSEGVLGGVAKEGDHGNEKLGADDIHFGEAMRGVDDAGVVEFAFGFEEGDENGIFTVFLTAVFIEFLEELFVFVFSGGGVIFVFHLEHDGDDFVPFGVGFAIDVVAFTTGSAGDGVVFFKVGVLEAGGAKAVELGFAVLFESFADHLGAEAEFHVFEARDFFVFEAEFGFIAGLEREFEGFLLGSFGFELVFELVALFFGGGDSFSNCEFLGGGRVSELGFEGDELGVEVGDFSLLGVADFGLGYGNGLTLSFFSKMELLGKFFLDGLTADLVE